MEAGICDVGHVTTGVRPVLYKVMSVYSSRSHSPVLTVVIIVAIFVIKRGRMSLHVQQ